MMITSSQIRMARAALRWKTSDLAERADLNWARVQQMERVVGVPNVAAETLARVKAVFEEAGVVFLESDGKAGAGIRCSETGEEDAAGHPLQDGLS